MYDASQHFRCIRTGSGPNDFRLELRTPLTIAIPTQDSASHPGASRYRGRDALLNAVPAPKVALGLVWNGDITPYRDFLIDVNEKLDTPLVPPRVLTAEGPGRVLNLGHVYDSIGAVREFADQIAEQAKAEGKADILREVDAFHAAMGTVPAYERPSTEEYLAGQRTGDDARSRAAALISEGKINPGRRIGDFSTPKTADAINQANRLFWEKRNSPGFDMGTETRMRNAEKLQAAAARQSASAVVGRR